MNQKEKIYQFFYESFLELFEETLLEGHTETKSFVKDQYGAAAVEPHDLAAKHNYNFKTAMKKGSGSATAEYVHKNGKDKLHITHTKGLTTVMLNHRPVSVDNLDKVLRMHHDTSLPMKNKTA